MCDNNETFKDVARERLEFLQLLASAGEDRYKSKPLKSNKIIHGTLLQQETETTLRIGSILHNDNETFENCISENICDPERSCSLQNVNMCVSIPVHIEDRTSSKKYLFKSPKTAFLNEVKLYKKGQSSLRSVRIQCDFEVYKWFNTWLKNESAVVLNVDLVYPILEFADGLEIVRLVDMCLKFWRCHIDQVNVPDDKVMKLSETVKEEFSNMFTNQDLPSLEENQFLQNYLYEKFIILLNSESPNNMIGHYGTTSSLFKCKFCDKLLTREGNGYIHCYNVTLDTNGEVKPCHKEDPDWSLCGFVRSLIASLKSLQLVYWTLWGLCHYLNCSACLERFPVGQINRCAYHPDSPHYSSDKAQVGYFRCCRNISFRFDAVAPRSGCLHRPHIPQLISREDSNIFAIYQVCKPLIENETFIDKVGSRLMKMDSISDIKRSGIIKKKTVEKGKGWTKRVSTGWNQDNQRELEEKKFKELAQTLTFECSKEAATSSKPLGGSYVAIYSEFWDNVNKEGDKNITKK